MAETFRNYINGEWVESASGETFANLNPADTSENLGNFQQSTREDVRAALQAAQEAFPAWAETPAPKRGRVLYKAGELLEQRFRDIAAILTREEGKPIREAIGEVLYSAYLFKYFGGEAYRLCGETTPSEWKNLFLYTERIPLGVVSIITPWNFPIAIPAWKTAPALACGNTVILKPASQAPMTALKLVEILVEAGVPKGVINFVTGPGSRVGDEMITNSIVKAVSFTGSCGVGKSVMEKTAPRLIKTQLEMGGKNPLVVLADADLSKAVSLTMQGAFMSTGQRCTATSRVIVEKAILQEYTERLLAEAKKIKVGNPMDKDCYMGPAVDEGQLRTDLEYIEIGKKEGAKLILGGNRLTGGDYAKGFFIEPTIFTDVNPKMRIAREEIFGPVLSIIPADNFEDALAKSNDVDFGLASAVCTRSLSKAQQFIKRTQSGQVMVNFPTANVEFQVPFGGMKDSSFGHREMGRAAIDFYSQLKTVYVDYND